MGIPFSGGGGGIGEWNRAAVIFGAQKCEMKIIKL